MNQSYSTTTPEGKRQVIDAYRRAVKSNPKLSLKSFCYEIGLGDGYKHVLWWANGQGISIYGIQRGSDQGNKADLDCPTFIQVKPVQRTVSSSLKAVSITFPDGINLSLQESGVEEVVALLDAYRSRHQAEGGAAPCSL